MKLNGFMRFQITKLWMQKGLRGDLEEYIRKVCELKDIKYVPLTSRKDKNENLHN